MHSLQLRLDAQGNCPHYHALCEVLAPCCGVFLPCRICHDEVHALGGHCAVEKMDRFAVQTVRCRRCLAQQEPGPQCVNCAVVFARYYCATCRLWQDKRQSVFHCEQCGICRVGPRENFEHCANCGICVARAGHDCKPLQREEACAVCTETIFDSRKGIARLKCRHSLHRTCLQRLCEADILNCPLCLKPMADESPALVEHVDRLNDTHREFSAEVFGGLTTGIICNACVQKSEEVPMALYGLKCPRCGSYNTRRT